MKSSRLGFSLGLLTLSAVGTASADEPPFYAHKQITFFVGTSVGGGYDLSARILAQFMPAHISGNPTIVVQNRAGGSGLPLTNAVYNAEPKDGTVMAMSPVSMILSEVLEPGSLSYKSQNFGWVGTVTTITDVLAVMKTTDVKTLDDAKHKQVVLGAGNKLGNPGIYPAVSNALLGTKFKVVLGYPGSTETGLAMEKGEIDGRTNQWDAWNAQTPQWVQGGMLSYLFQVGPKVDALAGVPTLGELVTDPDYKKVVDLLDVGQYMGRSVYVPPGVPPARLQILREAFDATVADPAYLARMKQATLDTYARKGAQLQSDLGRAMQDTDAARRNLEKVVDETYR